MNKIGFVLDTGVSEKEQTGKIYDIAIIGGGPAGLTAAIFGVRAGLDIIVVEKNPSPGGQIANSSVIENWPGTKSISGKDLLNTFKEHVLSLGVKIKTFAEVVETILDSDPKILKLRSGEEIKAKSIIICTGTTERKLSVPGEEKYKGKGVSYCAVCDAPFTKGKDVVVIGGGDSALDEGIYIAKFAKSVSIVHRRDKLRATKVLQERAFKNKKIKFYFNKQVLEILGKGEGIKAHVIGVKVKDKTTNEESIIKADNVFIYIGMIPNSDIFDVEKDERGYIKTNKYMETNVKGVFAAGDVRSSVLKQVITAASEGAIAAVYAEKYISKNEK